MTQAFLSGLRSNVLWSCAVIPQPWSLGNPLQLITVEFRILIRFAKMNY
jgi:hypothetical protein